MLVAASDALLSTMSADHPLYVKMASTLEDVIKRHQDIRKHRQQQEQGDLQPLWHQQQQPQRQQHQQHLAPLSSFQNRGIGSAASSFAPVPTSWGTGAPAGGAPAGGVAPSNALPRGEASRTHGMAPLPPPGVAGRQVETSHQPWGAGVAPPLWAQQSRAAKDAASRSLAAAPAKSPAASPPTYVTHREIRVSLLMPCVRRGGG